MKKNALFSILTLMVMLSSALSAQDGKPYLCPANGHTHVDERWTQQYGYIKWPCPILRYFFANNCADIADVEAQRNAFRAAMATWEAVTDYRFVQVCAANQADVNISWCSDPDCPPGVNSTLAVTYGNTQLNQQVGSAGDMVFNDNETWTTAVNPTPPPFDLQTIAIHELGHLLGLDHSAIGATVMVNPHAGSRRALDPDDVTGVQAQNGVPNPSNFISGPSYVCTRKTYNFLSCAPAGVFTINWSVSSNLVIVSGQGTSTIEVEPVGSTVGGGGWGSITATLISNCTSLASTPITRSVQIGYTEPLKGTVTPWSGYPSQLLYTPTFLTYNYFKPTVITQYATSFSWSHIGGVGYMYPSNTNTAQAFVQSNNYMMLRVTMWDEDNCVANNTMIFVHYRTMGLSVYPNPTTTSEINFEMIPDRPADEAVLLVEQPEGDVSVSMVEDRSTEVKLYLLNSVKVIDQKGAVRIEQNDLQVEGQQKLDVSTLEPGVYLLEVVEGDRRWVERFVKM